MAVKIEKDQPKRVQPLQVQTCRHQLNIDIVPPDDQDAPIIIAAINDLAAAPSAHKRAKRKRNEKHISQTYFCEMC